MRIKIKFSAAPVFKTTILTRICDINYGGHVGNDRILSILHEARLQMLKQWGYTEMNAAGCGLIMADSAVQYRAEAFHGDEMVVEISVENMSSISFDLFYKLSTNRADRTIDIAYAKTGMLAFDYNVRSIMTLPEALIQHLSA